MIHGVGYRGVGRRLLYNLPLVQDSNVFLRNLGSEVFFSYSGVFGKCSFFGHTRVLGKSGIYIKSGVFFKSWRFRPKNLSSEALTVSQEFSTPVVVTLVCNNPGPRTKKNQI